MMRFALFAAGLFILVCLFAVSDELQSIARTAVNLKQGSSSKQAFDEHLKRDPAIGGHIAVGSSLAGRNYLLVLVGNCEECAEKMILRIVELATSARMPAVYVSKVSPVGALSAVVDNPLTASVVIDSDGSIHEELNGFFTPRVFLIDEHGRLVWKQDSPELSTLAKRLKEVKP
jgi:hypothetical protein